jgi:hypothetical protein
MQYPKIANIELNDPKTIMVQLWIDKDMLINHRIERPAGDPDTWTIGQIKQLAIQAARSKIPQ